jgi:hypothetical protein
VQRALPPLALVQPVQPDWVLPLFPLQRLLLVLGLLALLRLFLLLQPQQVVLVHWVQPHLRLALLR